MVICPKCGLEGTPTAEIKKSNIYYRVVHHSGDKKRVCYLGPSKYKVEKDRDEDEKERLLAEYVALTKAIVRFVEDVGLALRKPNTLKTEEDRELTKMAPVLINILEKIRSDLAKAIVELRK